MTGRGYASTSARPRSTSLVGIEGLAHGRVAPISAIRRFAVSLSAPPPPCLHLRVAASASLHLPLHFTISSRFIRISRMQRDAQGAAGASQPQISGAECSHGRMGSVIAPWHPMSAREGMGELALPAHLDAEGNGTNDAAWMRLRKRRDGGMEGGAWDTPTQQPRIMAPRSAH